MIIRVNSRVNVGKIRLHISQRRIKEHIITFLCFLMFFACSFFTHNIVIKVSSLALLCFFGLPAYISKIDRNVRMSFLIGLIFPLTLIAITLLNSGDFNNAVRGSYCAVFFMSLPVILYYNVPLEKVYELTMRIVIVLVLGCILLDAIGRIDIFTNPLLLLMYDNNELQVATKGAQYITHWKVYLQADALLIIYACFCFEKKKYLWLVLCGLTMWFSGSMANPIAFVVCIGAMLLEKIGKTRLSRLFVVLGILIMTVYSIVPRFMSSPDMVIRASAIKSYAEIFKDLAVLLLGQGYGTDIYVSARAGVSSTTEWSAFEMIRWYGLIGFTIFAILIAYPIKRLRESSRSWMIYAVVSFLMIAFTNPLLYTTTGMLAYLMLYYEYFMDRSENMGRSIADVPLLV